MRSVYSSYPNSQPRSNSANRRRRLYFFVHLNSLIDSGLTDCQMIEHHSEYNVTRQAMEEDDLIQDKKSVQDLHVLLNEIIFQFEGHHKTKTYKTLE